MKELNHLVAELLKNGWGSKDIEWTPELVAEVIKAQAEGAEAELDPNRYGVLEPSLIIFAHELGSHLGTARLSTFTELGKARELIKAGEELAVHFTELSNQYEHLKVKHELVNEANREVEAELEKNVREKLRLAKELADATAKVQGLEKELEDIKTRHIPLVAFKELREELEKLEKDNHRLTEKDKLQAEKQGELRAKLATLEEEMMRYQERYELEKLKAQERLQELEETKEEYMELLKERARERERGEKLRRQVEEMQIQEFEEDLAPAAERLMDAIERAKALKAPGNS